MSREEANYSTKMEALRLIREEVSCGCVAAYLIGRLVSHLSTIELVDLAEHLPEWHAAHVAHCEGHGPVEH